MERKRKSGSSTADLSLARIVMRQIVYAGAGDLEVGGVGHVDCVVKKLLENYSEKGHSIYMDNYFNSVNLIRQLKLSKLYCTGTLRKNRKNNPKDVTGKKLKKNEYISRWSNDGICVLKWKDKRDILMISSEHGDMFSSVKSKRGTMREKPTMIVEYNKYMGGIDNLDQMLAYYPCDRKTLKWYKKLAIHFFQIMMVNSFKLFNNFSGNKKTFSEFRLQVIGELVANKESPTLTKSVPEKFLHFPRYLPFIKDGTKKRQQKRCRECYKKNVVKKTTTYCRDCPDKPGLCMEPCFLLFHDRDPN